MLRIHVSENATAAKQYYREGLTTSDYYVEKGISKGYWGGLGAERLGLSGEITGKTFDRLADNLHPVTGDKLTPRTKSNRRVGYDLTFNSPKSVSVIYGLGDRNTRHMIRTAFETAIMQTVTELEQSMYTRVRKNGQNSERQTGNMVWARFTHDTSRPIDGIPDPHLHTHVYAFNTTYDKVETRWKAGEFGHIKENAPYFEAVFHNHFASLLRHQGFGITPTKNRWELTGIPREIVKAFSQRTQEIDLLAQTENIINPKRKATLAARTRTSKQAIKSPIEIHQNWQDRYNSLDGLPLEAIKRIRPPKALSVRQVVSQTIDHVFERQSVVNTNYFLTTALRFGVGHTTQQSIYQELYKRGVSFHSIKGKNYMTLPHIINEEQRLLKTVKSGRGRYKPLGTIPESYQAERLNKKQKQAIEHVLSSTDFVTALIGKAGVGKTTVATEIKHNIEQSGKQVFAFATSSDASRDTLRKEGFSRATTVAHLLQNETLQKQLKGNVIYIDEASQIGTVTMNKLFALAKKQKARILLSGDIQQHGSVERGNPLHLLKEYAGLQIAEIDTIVRQKNSAYRNAVDATYHGKITAALEWLHTIDAFTEITDSHTRYKQLADDYFHSIRSGQSVLVVSPTHFEAEYITPEIRKRLKMAGLIRGIERSRLKLKPLHFTESQKQQACEYVSGYIVQLNQNIKGFTRGDIVQIITQGEKNTLLVKQQDSTDLLSLPLKYSQHFEVYTPSEITFARGDRIRITRNGSTKYGRHRLNNGAEYTIDKVKRNGDIILNNGWELDKNFSHLTYGYVSTSYASQSKTVDRVLIAQSHLSFGKASSKEQFYVSLSRGRYGVKIYTDDVTGLKKELTKGETRISATELATKTKKSNWFQQMKQVTHRYKQNNQPPKQITPIISRSQKHA